MRYNDSRARSAKETMSQRAASGERLRGIVFSLANEALDGDRPGQILCLTLRHHRVGVLIAPLGNSLD
jgi:hypothetical protein